jgi:hypothetical protein
MKTKPEFGYRTPGETLIDTLLSKLVSEGLVGYELMAEMGQRLIAGVNAGLPGSVEALEIHRRQMKEWAHHLLEEQIQRATHGDHPGA